MDDTKDGAQVQKTPPGYAWRNQQDNGATYTDIFIGKRTVIYSAIPFDSGIQ